MIHFPVEILYEIFYFLDVGSLGNCLRVNKHWNTLLSDNGFWNTIGYSHFPDVWNFWIELTSPCEYKQCYKQLYEQGNRREILSANRKQVVESVRDSLFAGLSVAILGDAGIGKTSLISSDDSDIFEEGPTLTTQFYSTMNQYRRGKIATLYIIDIPMNEIYDFFINSSKFPIQVCLVGFNCKKLETFHNVKHKWIPLIKHSWGSIPILLVALQVSDTTEETIEYLYKECSSLNLPLVFTDESRRKTSNIYPCNISISSWKDICNNLANLVFDIK